MSDRLPGVEKTGSLQIKFTDGTERTLPIHGITQLQILSILDESGVKTWRELETASSLAAIHAVEKVAAYALTFPKGETWTVEKMRESFADIEQIVNVLVACIKISKLPGAPTSKTAGKIGRTYG